MNKVKGVNFTDTGHKAILDSIQDKHQLAIVRTFKSNHTVCALARSSSGDEIFIKVKGYLKARDNEERLKRAITSNRMAAKLAGVIMPRTVEFRAFRRSDILWLTMISVYGGKPMSDGMFFDGDPACIDNHVIERLRHAFEAIRRTPALSVFHPPESISKCIQGEYGRRVANAASDWTSAHCDFHWGNILDGGNYIVDWDMFSLAPRGFDVASILLFSSSNMELFRRLNSEFGDFLGNDSARVATLFAASRILRLMRVDRFTSMQAYQPNIEEAVRLMTNQKRR